MSEALPENSKGLPEPEDRPPVAPPFEGTAPTLADPVEQPLPLKPEIESETRVSRFNVEQGGRSGMAGTAERIGSAVGMAQRQMRRGLELVRRPAGGQIAAVTMDADERASQMMESIEEEVSDARRQAAHKLDEWSKEAGERLQRFRREAQRMFADSRTRAEHIGNTYPLQTIAATAGVCFVLGVALRIRRSRRG